MPITATSADVITYMDVESGNVDSDLVDECLASAILLLADDYDIAEADIDRANLAAKMLATKIYKRRWSPNGIEAVGDWGPLRVSQFDPDVHRLMSRWELYRFG